MNDVVRYRVDPWRFHYLWYIKWANDPWESRLIQALFLGV